jgi:hypothetical protein
VSLRLQAQAPPGDHLHLRGHVGGKLDTGAGGGRHDFARPEQIEVLLELQRAPLGRDHQTEHHLDRHVRGLRRDVGHDEQRRHGEARLGA